MKNADDVPISGSTPSPVHLFVYGTLRRSQGASALLSGCLFLADGRLPGSLYDTGSYPALVLDGRGEVVGEVWSCSAETLTRLDPYEGVGDGLFERVQVTVEGRPCWTYVAGPRLASRILPDHRIASGDWTRRTRKGEVG